MQCHALKSSQIFRRCKRVQRKAYCYQHVPTRVQGFWRCHMKKAGLVPKIDPGRKWAILLDEECHAVVGYPEGKGLDAVQLQTWGTQEQEHTRWVLESDLYVYYSL